MSVSETADGKFAREILTSLGRDLSNITVAEFGAWDGLHKSNIAALVRRHGAVGVFIEADSRKFSKLSENYEGFDNAILINSFIQTSGSNTFDSLLARTGVAKLDFLSVDIDGNDYHVFKSIEQYAPDMLCIEFNPTIPWESNYAQPDSFAIGQGSSLRAMKQLLESCGYTFLANNSANGFFLKSDLCTDAVHQIASQYFTDCVSPKAVELYVGFDGTVFSNEESLFLNWHKVKIDFASVSPVPKIFRGIPESFSRMRKLLFYVWVALKRSDLWSVKEIKKRLPRSKKSVE